MELTDFGTERNLRGETGHCLLLDCHDAHRHVDNEVAISCSRNKHNPWSSLVPGITDTHLRGVMSTTRVAIDSKTNRIK